MPKKIEKNIPEERYSVMIPKVPGSAKQDDVVLTINGRSIQIQRGVRVEITRPYYESLMRWMEANDIADDYISSVVSSNLA